jgi:hypothetical protein
MSAPKSVLGVLGVCWVGFGYPTQFSAMNYGALRAVCRVCWVWRRVRACVTLIALKSKDGIFSYARAENPNKPNTLNTNRLKVLILKGFIRVGFVLGSGFFVSGSDFQGEGR